MMNRIALVCAAAATLAGCLGEPVGHAPRMPGEGGTAAPAPTAGAPVVAGESITVTPDDEGPAGEGAGGSGDSGSVGGAGGSGSGGGSGGSGSGGEGGAGGGAGGLPIELPPGTRDGQSPDGDPGAPADPGTPGDDPGAPGDDPAEPVGGPGGPGGPGGDPTDPVEEPTDPGAVACQGAVDPGHVSLHRLNRVEYDNTVRDLLDDVTGPAAAFPADDVGYGFDNIADVLSVSPLHVDKYAAAAEALLATALAVTPGEAATFTFEAEDLGATAGTKSGSAWNLYTVGTMSAKVTLPADGPVVLSAYAWQDKAGSENAKMTFALDGKVLETFDVAALKAAPQLYELETTATAGQHTFTVGFTNDFNQSGDRNLWLDWIAVEGQAKAPVASPTRAAIVTCDPQDAGVGPCAEQIVRDFARRAWRRPPTDDEIAGLAAVVDEAIALGGTFDEGIEVALVGVLVSPHFIYRVELDPTPDPHLLSGPELATRLSYLLWSSTPDEELLAAAEDGTLLDPEVLEAQALRLLDDPRAEALTLNFAGQWLMTRAVDSVTKDPELFPDFDAELREAMRAETELFFDEFLHSDASALDMIDADFTYVNDRLAEHYGLAPSGAPGFTRVSLDGTERGGLMRQASVLTVNSHPNRTSPVKRGKWVLGRLMCLEPPPPPPEVDGLIESAQDASPKTVKELMAQHTTDPMCAGCHTLMDPIGFGLENYDATGKWRTDEAGEPIDPAGTLFTGEDFVDPFELAILVKEYPEVPRCMVEHALTYALGRGLEAADQCTVETLVEQWQARGYRLRDLFVLIALSDSFRMRRAEVM